MVDCCWLFPPYTGREPSRGTGFFVCWSNTVITVSGARWKYQGDLDEDLDGVVGERARVALEKLSDYLTARIKKKLDRAGHGNTYYSKRGDGTKHKASAPGEPPAPDTRKYVNS